MRLLRHTLAPSRRFGWAVLLGVAAAVSLGWWVAPRANSVEAIGGQWHTATRESMARPMQLKGALQPVNVVNVVAPVEGRLATLHVGLGDKVVRGQVLARIDSGELLQQVREAEIGAIRAEQELTQVRSLETGAEYQAALRRGAAARNALGAARRHLAETQALYDKGIIARTELDGAQQEQESAASQVLAGEDEVATLRLKQSTAALRVLQLEHDNRRGRFRELQAKLRSAQLVSPIAGVVLYPTQPDTGEAGNVKEFKTGSFLTGRDVILSVGDTSAFVIKVWVDEADLDRVELQQAASITLAADPSRKFKGVVQRISSQARAGDARGAAGVTAPEFEVQILMSPLEPTPGRTQAPPLRVGASVIVKLLPKAGPPTMVVPLSALSWTAQGAPALWTRPSPAHSAAMRVIEVGRTTVDGVEVLAGIDEGDQVWVLAEGEAEPARRPGAWRELLQTGGEHE